MDERLFEVRATVVGTESEPMRVMEKTKRRNRHIKTVKSKMRFTILRVGDVKVKGVDEIEGMGDGQEKVDEDIVIDERPAAI